MDAIPHEATWREALARPGFRARAARAAAALVAAVALLARFLRAVERRPGAVLADPVLALLPPRDCTWLTFALIYLGIVCAFALVARRPRLLVAGAEAYVLLVLARMAVMWVTPLDPPPGMIRLADPLVQGLGGTGEPPTRDLFFSGHTSTLFLFGLVVPGRWARILFFAAAAGVGALVLVQHVHYAVDVFAAPFFAYGAWRLAESLWPGAARGARSPQGVKP